MTEQIRVLIIEDSILMTNVITDMLNSDPRLRVIGTARNGKEGIEKVVSLHPDVVTLDMLMPVMNGRDFLRNIMRLHPLPVVMLSAYTKEGARETIEGLNLGAVDFVTKPSGSISVNIREVREELIDKIILASQVIEKKLLRPPQYKVRSFKYTPSQTSTKIIIICSSTGGPRALSLILASLPRNLNACIIVIQHIPEKFTPLLAERLNKVSSLDVREARGGELLMKGRVYFAPGGKHMEVTREGRILLTNKPKKHSLRPSCDITLRSFANFGKRILAVVLTGMGKDGSEGLSEVKKANGKVIVEDRSTSVIFGMPKAAIKTGYVDKIVPLYDIAKEIIDFAR